jgi:hypothetical protein
LENATVSGGAKSRGCCQGCRDGMRISEGGSVGRCESDVTSLSRYGVVGVVTATESASTQS